MRRRMADRREFNIERRKSVYTKGQSIKSRDNLITS